MNEIVIPATQQIITMSVERCKYERMRLKNEISFARGNALWGGPSGEEKITAYKKAIQALEERLEALMCLRGSALDGHPAEWPPSERKCERAFVI